MGKKQRRDRYGLMRKRKHEQKKKSVMCGAFCLCYDIYTAVAVCTVAGSKCVCVCVCAGSRGISACTGAGRTVSPFHVYRYRPSRVYTPRPFPHLFGSPSRVQPPARPIPPSNSVSHPSSTPSRTTMAPSSSMDRPLAVVVTHPVPGLEKLSWGLVIAREEHWRGVVVWGVV